MLDRFSGTTVNFLNQFSELASNVCCVAVENWGVSVSNLTGVVHEDNLGVKGFGALGGVILGVTSDIAT